MALREPRFSLRRLMVEEVPKPIKKQTWQGYLLSQDDQRRIDALMGRALLDPTFCEELLKRCDVGLLAEFGFRTEIVAWLCSLEVTSLAEFAEAVTIQ
jgi:hypothetical protein